MIMPFNENDNTSSGGDTMLKWLTGRLDRLERLIDDLNAKITQMEHRLLQPPHMDMSGWSGAIIIVGVVMTTLLIMWIIYTGGRVGG